MTQRSTDIQRVDKAVLLTGGSSGIGEATALTLAKEGYIVYAASRSGKAPSNENIKALVLDVNDEASLEKAVKDIALKHGSLYALICNAGNGVAGAIDDTSIEEARYQFETTYFGAVKTVKAGLKQFVSQGKGKIITVSSVAGFIPIPYQAFYSSAKAALLILTKALSIEVRKKGIQCCCVLPGDTKTDFTKSRRIALNAYSDAFGASMSKSLKKMEEDEINGMSPYKIAAAISKELKKRKMRATVTPGLQYKAIESLSRFLPERLVLWLVTRLYG